MNITEGEHLMRHFSQTILTRKMLKKETVKRRNKKITYSKTQ
jgi:hypothetical protein